MIGDSKSLPSCLVLFPSQYFNKAWMENDTVIKFIYISPSYLLKDSCICFKYRINFIFVINSRITYENDVALLRLAEPLMFNQLVSPLAMPQPGQNFTSGKIELCMNYNSTIQKHHLWITLTFFIFSLLFHFLYFIGDSEMCLVSGWGRTSEGGSSSDILQYTEIPVVSDRRCRATYTDDEIMDSMICAG